MANKKTAVVIGAGIGGLATANILAKTGYSVKVYEKNATAGGRMGVLRSKGFTFDTGPSWYLMQDVFRDYFRLFNKDVNEYYELERLDPAYKVFYETTDPVTISGALEQNVKLFNQLEPGAGRQLESYIKRSRHNYEASLKYFLYNPFKKLSGMLHKDTIVKLPFLGAMFTQSLHSYVHKRFKRVELQQILEYPSVFLGASPFNTPALYQLMSYLDFQVGVFYPKRGGMYAVAEALVALGQELGVAYHYNAAVEKIKVVDGRATGVMVDEKEIRADLVISNADLHFTETKLLEKSYRSYPENYWSKRKAGPSALLLFLGIKGTLPEFEHHNLFFVKNWHQNFADIYQHKRWPQPASMYVSRTTATDKSTAPKGHENIFVLVPLPTGSDIDDVSAYVDACLRQLETMSGVADLRERIVYQEVRTPEYFGQAFNAWENTALGMSHTLRQSAFLRPSIKSKKVSNLYYVGAGTQPGIGVPMCLISAQLVYKHIAKDWSAGAINRVERLVK